MSRRGRPPFPGILTPRQEEVLALIREGLSNEQIASRLGISADGVKFHVSEILSRLGVSNRDEAARWRTESAPEAARASLRARPARLRLARRHAVLGGRRRVRGRCVRREGAAA